ncbi:hypothetical protein Mgra_00002118 [Meloidogyne graminicola]|uniref:Rhodanese domain-containing protein n=1 Tax=Meloidogyne graminicola TaxID=189291 RepID=A0A8S9ZYV7_9BILA|nr:hypothetical protein Mgra_00002118 [Meloidogyne graminicola]
MRELYLTPSPPSSSLKQRSTTPSSLFYLSHSFPSYRGSNNTPLTPQTTTTTTTTNYFIPIKGSSSLTTSPPLWKIPISSRSSIPAPKCHHHIRQQLKQTSSYCSVEEIKEGNIYYTEKGKEENEEEEEDDDDDDDDEDNYYEKAPNSRPYNAINLITNKKLNMSKQQNIISPIPPTLPPPNLSLLKEEMAKNGWQRKQIQQNKQNINLENKKELKEKELKKQIIFKQKSNKTKFLIHILLFALFCSLLLMALPLLLLWFTNPNIFQNNIIGTTTKTSPTTNLNFENFSKQQILKNEENIKNNSLNNLNFISLNFIKDLSIESSILAKLLEENINLRIFEIKSEQIIIKEKLIKEENNFYSQIPGSQLITIESLSHNGIPVHPLQFQKLLRSHSIDSNSIIILYDKHPLGLYSTYALWIFRLYGHNNTFFLNGGASSWNLYLTTNKITNINLNNSKIEEKLLMTTNGGNFRAKWNSELVATFDDLLTAFEPTDEGDVSAKVDIIDAQKPEEFDGHIINGIKSLSSSSSSLSSTSPIAIYGHIRTAMNIPIERLFLSTPIGNQRRWASSNAHSRLFARLGLTTKRHVIVYDEFSSLRAASIWAALQRTNFTSSLYFGAWPEWLIRAPDHLKILILRLFHLFSKI